MPEPSKQDAAGPVAAVAPGRLTVSAMRVAFVTVICIILAGLVATQYNLVPTSSTLVEYYARVSQQASTVIHRTGIIHFLRNSRDKPVLLKEIPAIGVTSASNITTNSSKVFTTNALILNNQTYDISLFGGRKIEMGCAITTAKIPTIEAMKVSQPFFKHLLPSFCKTASEGYMYIFYMGYDYNDKILSKPEGRTAFEQRFDQIVRRDCQGEFVVGVTFVKCNHTKHPAWAQNDAMMAGYADGMDYHYMINDDTILETKDWTNTFVNTLAKMKPTNVGMVGPKHAGGNVHILTYHFVHRTHIDIFGYFYPRAFTDWFGDDWISHIYEPHNVKKIANVKVKHTMEKGQRYAAHTAHGKELKGELKKSRDILKKYLTDQKVDVSAWFKGLKALR